MAVRRKRDASAAPRRAQPESPSRRASARKRGGASGRVLAKLRAICLALPEAQEKVSHGEPTWFAGKGKVFAMFDDHHHGAPHVSVWLPLPPGLQEALIEQDPQRYWRPPYIGHNGWVGVVLDTQPPWGVVAGLVEQAFRHVATAKLVAQLDERG